METQIHQLEQEAYTAVLRAFKAQSDAISWVLSSSFALIGLFCVLPVSRLNLWIYLLYHFRYLGKRKLDNRIA